MKQLLRSLTVALAASAGLGAFAQPVPPYDVTVAGVIIGCTPNSFVNVITVQGTQPSLNIDIPVDPNFCTFSTTLSMDSYQGWFQLSTPCQGAMQTQSVAYTVNALNPDSNYVYVVFNCGGPADDCLGVPGGNAQPGTSCTTFLGVPGTWSPDCVCIPDTVACNACFTVSQTGATPSGNGIPWSMDVSNCSSGTAPFTYQWWMPDGSTNTSFEPTFVFNAAGVYGICLTIADAGGCTSTLCDTVVVDDNGWISTDPVVWDCLQVPNGPNMPGTACTTALGQSGIWNSNCVCVTGSTGCEAGFWVIQAYEIDSLNPNGSATPIPNELWIWNLSSGTTGNYQFLWNFGDGTSSTEAYPTHFYPNGGPYVLCLTMWDGNCTDTYCDSIAVDDNGLYTGIMLQENYARSGFTINVLNELPTGLEEHTALENANLWPNPVTDAFTLSFQSTFSGNVPLSIYDMNGRVMHQENLAFNRGGNRIDLGAHQLAPGMYLLRVGEGANAMNIRFIKN